MKILLKSVVLVIIFVWWSMPALADEPKWTFDFESGLVVPGYNDVQIPNDSSADRFSLKDDVGVENRVYTRLRLGYSLSRRHQLSLLYAPLSVKAAGMLAVPVRYQGEAFAAGTLVKGLYRFNSYRLTYRYRLVDRPRLALWVGFTAKVRDAEINLKSGELFASKTNVGFVPLLHMYMDWQWGDRWGMILEADALAAKQGRAEDVSATVYFRILKNVRLKAGYRFVEGGSDGGDVYNFAFINYLSGGLAIQF